MPQSHLRSFALRLKRLEALPRPPDKKLHWPLEQQVQMCRSLLGFCLRGDVERTLDSYHAVTKYRTWAEAGIPLGRMDQEEARQFCQSGAVLLNMIYLVTGKCFPADARLAELPDGQFLEAVYGHLGKRIFE